jgi:ribosome maturation protein SDO1
MSVKGRQTMDHERISFNMVRLKKGGNTFEIAVDPDLAIDFKNGKDVDVKEVVKSEHIFADVNKGMLAQESHLKDIFGTNDILKVAEVIIKEGGVQLTAEYRQKVRDAKKKKLITIIAQNAVDPKTNLPHPPQRIENAMEEARVKIDEFKTAEDQVDRVVKALRPIIPIKFETKRISVKIGSQYAGKAYSTISRFAKPENESWNNDGSYTCHVEIPAGLEPDFYDTLNNLTHGSVETSVEK